VSASTVALPSSAKFSDTNAISNWSSVFDFLCERFPTVTPQEWSARFAEGLVLNEQGDAIHASGPYTPNALIHYYRRVPEEPELPLKARVLFQDAQLVVADKPHFMPVTPAGRYVRSSLLVQLKEGLGIDTLSPLHRIDRETAGLVLFSVNPQDVTPIKHCLGIVKCIRLTKRLHRIAMTWFFPLRTKVVLRRMRSFFCRARWKAYQIVKRVLRF
jgi:tRNA pseudouridine32 synthase/23S rRNA pseudouridine746 synthase